MTTKTRRHTSKNGRTKRPFGEFVLGLETSNALVQTFIDHTRLISLPSLFTWSEVRSHLNRVGADQSTFIGARLAWREYASEAVGKKQQVALR
jgi:hypothetical protein